MRHLQLPLCSLKIRLYHHNRFHLMHSDIMALCCWIVSLTVHFPHTRLLVSIFNWYVIFMCTRTQRSKCASWQSSLQCCLMPSSSASSSSTWTDWWTTPWRCTRTGRLWTCGASRRKTLSERSKKTIQYLWWDFTIGWIVFISTSWNALSKNHTPSGWHNIFYILHQSRIHEVMSFLHSN